MNIAAIQRIAWKELRQQASFFIALLAISIVVLASAKAVLASQFSSTEWPVMIFGLFGALFGAASGGVLFAAEKESETHLTLQMFPIGGRELAWGKIGPAVVLTILFFAICAFIAWAMGLASTMPPSSNVPSGFQLSTFQTFLFHYGLVSLETFAWSTLISVFLRRPLVSALLGIVTSGFVVSVIVVLTNGTMIDPYQLESYVSTLVERSFVVVVILALDLWLATRWLLPTRSKSSRSVGATTEMVLESTTDRIGLNGASSLKTIPRHIWQVLRSSWPLMVMLLPLFPLAVLLGQQLGSVALMCVAGSVAGAFTHERADQGGNFQFLAYRGARPLAFSLTHFCIWAGWIVLAMVCCQLLLLSLSYLNIDTILTSFGFAQFPFASWPEHNSSKSVVASAVGTSFLASLCWCAAAIVGLAAGQFCSVLIQSRLLAGFAAFLVAVPLGVWVSLVFASAQPLASTLLPVLAALLFATWIAVGWVFHQQLTAPRAVGLAAFACVVWCFVSAGVMYSRATEIPQIRPNVGAYRNQHEPTGEDFDVVSEIRRRFQTAYFPPDDRLSDFDINWSVLIEGAFWARRDNRDLTSYGLSRHGEDYRVWTNWRHFLEANPDQSFETQIDLIRGIMARHQAGFDRFRSALQFAMDNLDTLRSLPPWQFHRGMHATHLPDTQWSSDSGHRGVVSPPIDPVEATNMAQLMRIRFQLAAYDNDSHGAWLALRDLLRLQSLRGQIFVDDSGASALPGYLWQWLSMDSLEEFDIREAFELTQQDWFLYPSPERALEHDYLTMSAIVDLNARMLWEDTFSDSNAPANAILVIPGEHQRSQRLLNVWALAERNHWSVLRERSVKSDSIYDPVPVNARFVYGRILPAGTDLKSLVETTVLPIIDFVYPPSPFSAAVFPHRPSSEPSEGTDRTRVSPHWYVKQDLGKVTIRLAKRVWTLDHGSLPPGPEVFFNRLKLAVPVEGAFDHLRQPNLWIDSSWRLDA